MKFKGFLISPVCQIASSLGSGFENEILIEINELPISKRDQATYNEIAHKHNIKLEEALYLNDKVEIQWFGNTKADGTGKNIGNLTSVGLVTNINRSASFPYEVTVGKKIAGYYPRSSLIKTRAPLTTYLNSSVDNIKTNNDVAFTVRVLVSDLNIRTGPGTNYTSLGFAEKNKVYSVYRTQSNGKYTWYKISKDHDYWIANNYDKNDP